MKLDSYLKWVKDIKVRPENIKLLEDNKEKKLSDINLASDFFFFYETPKAQEIKAKNKHVGLAEKLLHIK